ncbi:MAG: nucleotidyltransferase family protein, partial [Terracidiphilus sp.]
MTVFPEGLNRPDFCDQRARRCTSEPKWALSPHDVVLRYAGEQSSIPAVGSCMQSNQDIVDLLRFIVRCDPRNLSGAGAAPTGPIQDWDAFIALAEQHRIGPLCHAVLEGTGAALPVAAAQKLARVRERHSLLNLARAAELLQVLEAFHAAKIDVMPFKGVVLAAQIYGDITLRAAGDLDLLIRWEDLGRATEIIHARGYKLVIPLRPDGRPAWVGGFEYKFERPFDGMILELSWKMDFLDPSFPHLIGLD